MSLLGVLKSLVPFVSKDSADVAAAVKKITDKAASDVAAVRSTAATAAQKSALATKEANFDALVSDYKAYLASQKATLGSTTVPIVSAGPTGATGA